MALTPSISTNELARQAQLAFEGQPYSIFLAYKGTASVTVDSPYTEWSALEVTDTGYARVTGTIGTGSYSLTTFRYELPQITAVFNGGASGFSYDTICIRIGTGSYLYGTIAEGETVVIGPSQTRSYLITLCQDD